jgi:hypothetical protein
VLLQEHGGLPGSWLFGLNAAGVNPPGSLREPTPDQVRDRAALKAEIGAIAEIQGRLRYSHLKYHLATVELLTPAQMQRYAELRGYTGERPEGHRLHHSD